MKNLARKQQIENFLQESNLKDYNITPLKQDASQRKYFRLTKEKESFILMDCLPNFESVNPFIKVSEFLLIEEFSVPKIYFQDNKNGFLILEDFGNNSLNNYLTKYPHKNIALYKLALDNLIKLSKIKVPNDFPKHDQKTLIAGTEMFQQYFLPNNDHEFTDLCQNLFKQLDYNSQHISLRDFHADNLMYLDNRSNYQKIGLLDYQDSSQGFLAYDLISLIQDARRFIPVNLQNEFLKYFLTNIPHIDKEKFMKEYQILSFQRNSRIIGLFNKFHKEDNNPDYLKYLDNVFKYFKINLESKFLKDIKEYCHCMPTAWGR